MSHVKAASDADLLKAASLLERIRSERPDHWPHGLSPDMFEAGDLFLIRKQAAEDPVGFVGWQERNVNGERVGLYSIGVLPEYRHRGIAKAAVAQLLSDRCQRVDRVAALVVPGNMPSEKLATTLGIPVIHKMAMAAKLWNAVKWTAPRAAGGVGNAAFWDYTMSPDRPEGGLPFSGEWNSKRVGNTLLNTAIGGTAAHGVLTHTPKFFASTTTPEQRAISGAVLGAAGTAVTVGTPTKDLLIYAPQATKGLAQLPGAVRELGDKVKDLTPSASPSAAIQAAKENPWPVLVGAGLLAGALGGGAYMLQKAVRDKAEAPVNITTQQGGRLKVTLPTKNPNDSETSLDLPFDKMDLPPTLLHRLKLDTRRELYAETKERIRRRKTNKLQPVPI